MEKAGLIAKRRLGSETEQGSQAPGLPNNQSLLLALPGLTVSTPTLLFTQHKWKDSGSRPQDTAVHPLTHGNAPQRKRSQDVGQDSLTPKSLLSTQLTARKSGPSPLCTQGKPRQQETTPTGRRVVSLQIDPSGSEHTNSLTAPSRHWSLPDVANAQSFIHPRITSDGAPTQNYIVQPLSATASKARLHCLLQAGGMAQKVKGLATKSDVVTPWVPPDSCMLASAFCTVVHACSPACNR